MRSGRGGGDDEKIRLSCAAAAGRQGQGEMAP